MPDADKVFRMVLTPKQVIEALGNYVARHQGVNDGTATAHVMFIYDLNHGPDNIQIKQARVELLLSDKE